MNNSHSSTIESFNSFHGKSQIIVGQTYGFREKPGSKGPLQKVKILQHIRGKKWKAEWLDPNPGLVDYIESQHLIIRWKDQRAYLRDEENERKLREDNERNGFKSASPLENVLSEVYQAVGEDSFGYNNGVLSGPSEAFERVKNRAHIKNKPNSIYSYTDRFGKIHVPFSEALEIAKAFCQFEPEPVLAEIAGTERKWAQEASRPGGEYLVSLLNEYRAAWAIIRQWTGLDAAITQREKQIEKLERLVWDAIYALQKAGADEEAGRLRRSLNR